MNGEQMESERAYKRFLELARRADRAYAGQFTRFLDPAGRETALRAAEEECVPVRFWGGYPDAERVMACFGEDMVEEWPVSWLKLGFNPRYGTPGHRDLLARSCVWAWFGNIWAILCWMTAAPICVAPAKSRPLL